MAGDGRSKLLLGLAAWEPGVAAAAGEPCTAERTASAQGSWLHPGDQSSAARDITVGADEVKRAFAQTDRYPELIRQVLPGPTGRNARWSKVFNAHDDRVRIAPRVVAQELSISFLMHFCAGSVLRAENVGRPVFSPAHHVGQHRGVEAYERPLRQGFGTAGNARLHGHLRDGLQEGVASTRRGLTFIGEAEGATAEWRMEPAEGRQRTAPPRHRPSGMATRLKHAG
jgi:hypothetical protein